jgi:tetratricopeptide (TPR) repeat protein
VFGEKRYEDALPFYRELHSLKWARPAAYLEAAECFAKTGRRDDAVRLATETIDELHGDMGSELAERAGDLLGELGDDSGAIRAYRLASEKLRSEP